VLTSTVFITKSSLYKFLGDMIGEGLLFSTDQKWFNRRKIITPTFHFKILEQFFDVFQKQNEILLKQLREKANGQAFNIFPFISLSVLKSLCGELKEF
jgi:cytochrome P450 family 4